METKTRRPNPSTQPLWKTNIPKRDRLTIINKEDLPMKEFLTALGIQNSSLVSSFGITDEAELRARHDLCQFLTNNQAFMVWMNDYVMEARLPVTADQFFHFYDPANPHNPYWTAAHQWLDMLGSADNVPLPLQRVVDQLRRDMPLETVEQEMSEVITQRLKDVTIMSGMMNFTISIKRDYSKAGDPLEIDHLSYVSGEVYGHRKYSQQLSTDGELAYPDWTENERNPLNRLRLGELVQGAIHALNSARRKSAYRSMVIHDISVSMKQDVERATQDLLGKLKWDNADFNGGTVNVLFSYNETGLKITILTIEVKAERDNSDLMEFDYDFEGHSEAKIRQMKRAAEFVKGAQAQAHRAIANNAIVVSARQQCPTFFSPTAVDSPRMDAEYRWFAIENEYQSDEFRDIFRVLMAQRRFFRAYYAQLQAVCEVLCSIQETAHKFGVPMCQPEIVTDGHVVDFGQLYPTQLLYRLKRGEVTPIHSLPELNGRMIALTGHHGGGKSETQISIVANIFLAQSGLPVFGEFFRFNVKRVLGMVFIAQRGQGSTCEMLLVKIRNILQGIKGIDGKEVVLVLDEVGTGTQEMAGLELGQDLLLTLARSGVSVIFSTQITSLAEFARDELNALCFQLDSEHQVTEGIGDGGMQQLRQRTGVEKLLQRAK